MVQLYQKSTPFDFKTYIHGMIISLYCNGVFNQRINIISSYKKIDFTIQDYYINTV